MLVSECLDQIEASSDPGKALAAAAYYGFSDEEQARLKAKGLTVYAGKVRELVRSRQDLYIFHTDRLTAFDRYIGMVPFKGLMLSELSDYWMKACGAIVPTAYQGRINERCLHAQACEPIKAEIIVRAYLAGSMQRAYERGERSFCGHQLPEDLQAFRALPTPIITPTSKAAAFEHDEDSSAEELIKQGVVTESEWQQIQDMSLSIFALGKTLYAEKGWLLVDTKYEFGRRSDGKIVLIDEVHTPDSSRLWTADTYEARLQAGQAPEMLDKENVRRYLLASGFSGHGEVPPVPAKVLVELARVYLGVTEAMLGHRLHTTDAGQLPPELR